MKNRERKKKEACTTVQTMMTDVEQKKERRENEERKERKDNRPLLSRIETSVAADKSFSLLCSLFLHDDT
jgi:hypothetical protein